MRKSAGRKCLSPRIRRRVATWCGHIRRSRTVAFTRATTRSSFARRWPSELEAAAHAQLAALAGAFDHDHRMIIVNFEAFHFDDGIADFHFTRFTRAECLIVDHRQTRVGWTGNAP